MLLGPRLSGRIYGSVEQNALQVLCGQLAIAIDNAQLFTEVQNAKIYNEILLQNLTTGVIAASADGVITVFNNEAEQITGLDLHGIARSAGLHAAAAAARGGRETLRIGRPPGESRAHARISTMARSWSARAARFFTDRTGRCWARSWC